jgi:hypothetical protein
MKALDAKFKANIKFEQWKFHWYILKKFNFI